ncbi:hypothetical protein KOR42_03760 [Thalassoglobus neptunius]|uniref:Ser-Thr-rich glycosyl-phosphatidyl-inositol-anchored membrane family protein n=1 Tax=Thalassoglobus neptunius TaxID=1938619 RepID=A0A5C5X323_9PLAN|nr:hypothetical protein [Thalassoglobus neptunius]TWT57019.1 hypothetical protein KOR42_03760 [Thalassoglobus neptunius]
MTPQPFHSLKSIRKLLGRSLLCLAGVTGLLNEGTAQTPESAPIFSKSNKFRIPFDFDPAELKRLGANEIQLFVSDNRGASWKRHESVDPAANSFVFKAQSDGEYWFSVRTLAAGGLTYPAGPHVAGLKVVVDSSAPRLSVEVEESASGRIEMKWDANDDFLVAESLKIDVFNSHTKSWEPVAINQDASGRVSWTVDSAGVVEVRASVEDLAGNHAESSAQAIVSGLALPNSPGRSSAAPVAANQPSGNPFEHLNPSHQDSSQPKTPVNLVSDPKEKTEKSVIRPASEANETPTQPDAVGQTSAPVWATDSTTSPIVKPEAKSSKSDALTAASVTPRPSSTLSDSTTTEAASPSTSSPSNEPMSKEATQKEAVRAVRPVNPQESSTEAVDQNLVLPEKTPSVSTPQTEVVEEQKQPVLPPRAERGHVVNSATFEIGYQVDGVGPTGVNSIELYITEDRGQKWYHYGSDADRTSPINVTVPRDGEYGFSFRVRNGVGVLSTPPQPGEAPEITVFVDRTPPRITLNPIQYLSPENLDQLVITWKIEEVELAKAPVVLSYATFPTGPWTPIAQPMENVERYVWNLPNHLNSEFYVRIEARDSAGNTGYVRSSEAFVRDTSQPRAQVTGVEPIRQETSRQ